MKQKEKITLKKMELGQFEIRLAEKKVTIQSKNKMWKVEYTSDATPYMHIAYSIENNDRDSLQCLVLAMYNMNLFFTSAEITKDFLNLCAEKLENVKPSQENEKEAIEDVKNIEDFKAEAKMEG